MIITGVIAFNEIFEPKKQHEQIKKKF